MLLLPKIYPITNAELAGISHGAQVRKLADAGCGFVQIREKAGSSRVFYEAVAEALAIAKPAGMKIIVNDRVDIAIATKAHGVHLGQDDLPPTEARRLLGDEAIIGYSTHSVEQAIRAAELPIDYLAIGPVFTTATKEDPDPVVGLAGISRVRDAVGDLPLVAIGGIDAASVHTVLEAGADSAAIISGLSIPGMSLSESFISLQEAANVKH